MYNSAVIEVCSSVNCTLYIYFITKPQFHLSTFNHSFEITLFLTKIVVNIF